MNSSESESLEGRIVRCAQDSGIETVGFADVRGLEGVFHESIVTAASGLGHAVSLAFRLSDAVVDHLVDGPTLLYKHQYKTANWILDQCAEKVARQIESAGGRALAIPASQTVDWSKQVGHLSHKAIAARSGLGWIGRSGLLVNSRHGARLRFSTVLTDLSLSEGRNGAGNCGECALCLDLCPGGAITIEGYDMERCLATLRTFSGRPGIGVFICGMCVKACPVSK